MKANLNHRFNLLRTTVLLVITAIVLAACSPSIVALAPQNEDIFWPYHGIDDSLTVSCEQNRNLFAYDSSAPLDIQDGDSQHSQGLTVADLTYASPLGGRVPTTLVVPDGSGPFAGILMQHGMGGAAKPNARKDLLPEAEAYARMGALVILIDAPFNRPEHGRGETLNLTEQDRREQIQYIVDLRRAVDLLLSRPEVDPQRLAYMGYSGGGAIGGLLAGVEDRIKGYALVVGDGGIVTHVTGPEDFMWWDYRAKGLREQWIGWMWPIEPIHYVRCAAPAALLFQNATHDESVNITDALRYQQAGSQPKTIIWYKAGHNDLSTGEPFKDRAEWLQNLLGLASYPGYPAVIGYALIIWFLLTAGSLAFLVWQLWRNRPAPNGARLIWILTTLFLGPVGLVLHWLSGPGPQKAMEPTLPAPPARRALGSAAWAAAGNAVGEVAVLALMFYLPTGSGRNFGLQIAMIFLLPFCAGWLIFAISRWISRPREEYEHIHRRPIFAELVSTCLVLVGVYPTVIILIGRWLSRWAGPFGLNLSYVPLWGALCLGTIVGMLVAYPFHLWMIRRGVIRWGAPGPAEEGRIRIAWYLKAVFVAISFIAMVAALLLSNLIV